MSAALTRRDIRRRRNRTTALITWAAIIGFIAVVTAIGMFFVGLSA